MKRILIVAAASVALCTGLPNPSIADQPPASKSGASVETTVADLERRIDQLEAKIGGETAESAFRPRGPKVRYPTVPAQASSLN